MENERQRPFNLVKFSSRLLLAFLSSIFLFGFLILLTLKLTLFSEGYIEKQAAKADYYSQLTEEVNQQIENNALGSNIPSGVLAQSVSEELVKKDVQSYFKAMYENGYKYEIADEAELKESIIQKIKNYASENQIEIAAETQASITSLAEKSVEIYKGYIELPFLISFGRRVTAYESTVLIFMLVCGILFAILSFSLYSSLRGYFHRLLRYWEYIFVGSGLMLVVLPSIIFLRKDLKKIGIQSKAMYDFIQNYLASFLRLFILIGSISIAIGILCAIMGELKRKKLFEQ